MKSPKETALESKILNLLEGHPLPTALAHALFNVIGTLLLTMTFLVVFAESGVRAPAFFH